jgi:uncharacterized protein (DUF1800 family)
MELFTLGEGKYSEQDIKEAARAFTGWSIDLDTGEFRFRQMIHDHGKKIVLGRSLDSGDEVLDVLLAHPATAPYIAARLWREFVSLEPQADELARVAAAFRNSGYDVRAAMRALLLTPAFWSPENRGALIKSPADLVVGTMRQFRIEVNDPLPFVFLMRALGQDLFSPPNVKGWPGGEAWINSTTLLARKQFLERLLRVEETRMMMQKDLGTLKPGARRLLQAMADLHFSARDWLAPFEGREALVPLVLLAGAPAGNPSGGGMEYLRALVADPVYQLK